MSKVILAAMLFFCLFLVKSRLITDFVYSFVNISLISIERWEGKKSHVTFFPLLHPFGNPNFNSFWCKLHRIIDWWVPIRTIEMQWWKKSAKTITKSENQPLTWDVLKKQPNRFEWVWYICVQKVHRNEFKWNRFELKQTCIEAWEREREKCPQSGLFTEETIQFTHTRFWLALSNLCV